MGPPEGSAARPWPVPDRRGPVEGNGAAAPGLPDYLERIYGWAYLRPASLAILDRPLVVSAILWGNYRRLLRATLAELGPGDGVLQPACVYGDFSARIAAHLGAGGRLRVGDVAPLQVENCRRKLAGHGNASVHLRDAAETEAAAYDAVCCFFLLHELPDRYRRRVVDALLGAVRPGGKVVFVDYHRPHPAHPMRAVMSAVFDALEPFAKDLWRAEIADFAADRDGFAWRKETYFGGLFQKTVAERTSDGLSPLETPPGGARVAGR